MKVDLCSLKVKNFIASQFLMLLCTSIAIVSLVNLRTSNYAIDVNRPSHYNRNLIEFIEAILHISKGN